MNESKTKAQRVARWLADKIMLEMEKPEEEIDVAFVESCENLLNAIMGERKLSDSEIDARVAKIIERSSKVYIVPKKRKIAFIAVIAAIVFLLSGITVCATTTLGENILRALNLGINQSFEDEGITYIYGGKSVNYKSIDEFLDSENISICFPEKIAYNAKLIKVHRDETNNYTIFVFDDTRISFQIHHGAQPDPAQFDDAEIVEFNNYIFYVLGETKDLAVAIINNNFYNLHCEDKNQLLEMIYSFNFERIE